MIKAGLTGGIGSGKSTVASIFERLGVPVFYADAIAKELMLSDQDLRQGITGLLGNTAYDEYGMNRQYIAGKIFNDPALLKQMNSLVHPAVYRRFQEWCNTFRDKAYIIHEAAVLLEGGGKELFDYIILVTAPEKLRIERVIKRDGVPREKVLERMKNQLSESEKTKLSDFIIDNGYDSLILPQILDLHNKFMSIHN